ncbi:MAG: ABC transporter substrate-binding protein, partial [Lachnospiraceae bacterium]|nr:ABC transporter substrate-binding protein [Lachnospiraceae bacterium]
VVALTASDCEIIYALGAGDTLVGRGEYCDYPEDVFAVPSVQSGYETNIEQIIELAPQVVIMATMARTEEQVKALEDAGIRVVVSDAQNIDGVYEAITLIGEITGKSDNAVKLVADMKDTFADLEARAGEINKEGEKKTIYFEVSPLEYGLWAAGSGTFMNEVAEMLGLENIFGDVEGWAQVSEEQVIEKAPDYIVTITMYFGEGPTPIEEIKGRAGWEGIPAVAEDQIINLQNNELSRPGPRLMEGAELLFDFIYQEEAEEPAA